MKNNSLLLSIVLNLASAFETLAHATVNRITQTKGTNKTHSGRRAASQPAGTINPMTANATQQDAGSSISPSSSVHSVLVLSANNKTKPDNVAVLPSSSSTSSQLDDASTAIHSAASTARRTSSPSILSDRSSAGAPLTSAMSSCATSDPRSSSPASSGAVDDGTSACDDPHAGRGRSRSAGARHRSWSDSQHTGMLADILGFPAAAPVDGPTDAMAAGPMDPTTVHKAAQAEHVASLIVSDINALVASLQLSSRAASPRIASSSRMAALPGGPATTATASSSGTLSGDDDDDAHVMTSFTVIDDELSGAVWFEDTDSEEMDEQDLGDDVSSLVSDALDSLDSNHIAHGASAEECVASPHKGSSASVLDDSLDMFHSMDQSLFGDDDIVIVDVAPAETSSLASNSIAIASAAPETAAATGAPKRGLRSKLSRGAKCAAKKVFGKLAKSLRC
eukprot:m51a1_g9319 hypothetical protein (451) ;mRNA; f:131468-135221